uniref:Uncharacterized protein n=1 Tax=Pyrodinium bahamense TaxID=73915 RepID=A0A7S0FLN1_9DINO|mmetsp:Transcript_37520/g.104316  ORF Transcript_37520/g.104316 Transcript_37520/m.104316 type:complete len:464 (+) Transcript_37520:98-1489(+)|eukprot:CAMPEP_0179025690 /NCGR_PEP_ID=MMETSP0796-20121207/8121_1 /TAXON_ID=73915 /ORGANISM="Pyrodinium bahamense, Strain pbaha01" /LENGTH=463 /DNA_ID=CAMNT_0020721731 /DNA_START=9 /DNA_END=1400 /DNA_ORIENTATION=+
MDTPDEERRRLLIDLVNPRLVRLKRAFFVALGILMLQGMAFAAGAVYFRVASTHTESMLMDAADARAFGSNSDNSGLCGTFTEGTNILAALIRALPPIKVCRSRSSDTCAGGTDMVTALAYEENRFQAGQIVDALRGSSFTWTRGTVARAFSNHTYTVQWSDGKKPDLVRPSQMRQANTTSDQPTSYGYSDAITFLRGFEHVLYLWAPLLLGPHESLRSSHADLEALEGIYMVMLNYSRTARWPATDDKNIRLTKRGMISHGFCTSYDDWGRTVAEVSDSRREAVAFANGISRRFAHIVLDFSSGEVVQKYGNMDFDILTNACNLSRHIWSLDFHDDALQWLAKLQSRTQELGRTWPCELSGRQCGSYECFAVAQIGCIPKHECADSVVSVHKALRRSWTSCLLDSAQLVSNYELIATGVIMLFYMCFTRGLAWCNAGDMKDLVKIASEGSTRTELEAMHRGE